MTKCRLTSAHLVFGLMTFVCTATAAPPLKEVNRHCVIRLEAAGSDASQVPVPRQLARQPECYPTFRDAIFFATKGIILLPSKQPFSVQLEIVDQELKTRQDELTAASVFVAAIDYEHSNYQGATLTWESSGPCTPEIYFYKNSMPFRWNDVLSSTRGYSDCGRNVLFEHVDRRGATWTCWPNCSSVGWMNDKTSSREMHHICEGAFCGNGRCETSCNESSSTCSIDCPVCGNGVCESLENSCGCPNDCGFDPCCGAFCGDGICQDSCGESIWTCPGDCGGTSDLCGDGFCDVFQGECSSNCPQDCTSGELCQ
jgi:hypothetical protein